MSKNPLNRQVFTIDTLHDIYDKTDSNIKYNNTVYDKDIAYKIIMLKEVDGHENISNLSIQYIHLYEETVTDEQIIKAVQEDYRTLAFISDKRITDNIINAVKEDYRTLKFIPKEKR
jgi:hypothetical protein